MTSAFERDIFSTRNEQGRTPVDIDNPASESETEDEEVRINCIGGFCGVDDSDMNTTDHSECGDDILSEDEMGVRYVLCANFLATAPHSPTTSGLTNYCISTSLHRIGVVKFVANCVLSKSEVPLVCPKATSPAKKRLSPHEEEVEEEVESDADCNGLSIATRRDLRSPCTPGATNEASLGEDGDVSSDEDSQTSYEEYHQVVESLSDEYGDAEAPQCSAAVGGSVEEDKCDFELTNILESLGDSLECAFDESESSCVHYIGVMEDREFELTTLPKTKRVLSHSTLVALNMDDCRSNEKLKRAKSSMKAWSPVGTSLLSTFSLGPPALFLHKFRDEHPASDDEDLDRQLGEELDGDYQADGDGNETPVPLLTPPGSPLTVEWEGNTTTVCEWPSNLTVDSAMQAVNELRPMSPTSLENLERDEQDRVAMAGGANGSTSLTPLLRSIYVGSTWG
jgi:hypothetical protein